MKIDLEKIKNLKIDLSNIDIDSWVEENQENLDERLLEFFKSGGKIHIKKKNRGKFTASAKRAGKSVQQHAKDVLNDPNATPLQKKRANFARNSARWHKK